MHDLVAKKTDREITESSFERLQRLHKLGILSERDLLARLEGMGLLQCDDTCRFSYPGIEMYFATSYIRRHIEQRKSWPPLEAWTQTSEEQRDFLPVLDFLRKLFRESSLLSNGIPFLCNRYLTEKHPHP